MFSEEAKLIQRMKGNFIRLVGCLGNPTIDISQQKRLEIQHPLVREDGCLNSLRMVLES